MDSLDKVLIGTGVGVSGLIIAGTLLYASTAYRFVDTGTEAVIDYIVKPVIELTEVIEDLNNHEEKRGD